MMNMISIAFANDRHDPLPSLTEEDEKVFAILSGKKADGTLDLVREQFVTTSKLGDMLFMYQKQISVFLYSGHAGKDRLLLEDQSASASGVAALLGRCPNLKLVILNGCSTDGQVKNLLAAGVPVVIATSAPVEDASATRFSIAFFKSLAERMNTVQEAYEDGLAAAKLVGGDAVKTHRFIKGFGNDVKGGGKNEPVWGIFNKPDNEIFLQWRLGEAEAVAEAPFVPNVLLLEAIWESILPHVAKKKDISDFKQNDIIDEIITELPHPISDYLRKLIASKRQGETEVFYNELGADRLKYLIYTYTNCIEILTFSLLAQLWDELGSKRLTTIPNALKRELERFFNCNFRERKTFSLIPLVREIRICFERHNIPFFIEEFAKLSEIYNEKGNYYEASMFIEDIRSELIDEDHIPESKANKLCIDIEKQLAEIMRELGFLAKYKMASMKGIDFIKYKHNKKPRFRHNFVELRYRPSGMNLESETLADSMDNASVIFIHHKSDTDFAYLNLSPFIIDVNSFDDKAQLADLCLFLSIEKGLQAFTYRYMYKPTAFPLCVDASKAFADLLKDQFNVFYQLIFQKDIEL